MIKMSDWLITRVLENSFFKAKKEVDRRAIVFFYPRCRIRKIVNGKMTYPTTAVFPGYLFIYSPLFWYHLLDLPGLVTIVKSASTNEPYRSKALDRIIAGYQKAVDDNGLSPTPDVLRYRERLAKFIYGDKVRVVNGVFTGFSGLVEETSGLKVTVSVGSFHIHAAEDDLVLEEASLPYHLSSNRRRRSKDRIKHMQAELSC